MFVFFGKVGELFDITSITHMTITRIKHYSGCHFNFVETTTRDDKINYFINRPTGLQSRLVHHRYSKCHTRGSGLQPLIFHTRLAHHRLS